MRALYAFDRVGPGQYGGMKGVAESGRIKGEGELGQQGWRRGGWVFIAVSLLEGARHLPEGE